MFDWDTDFDAVVEERRIAPVTSRATETRGVLRCALTRWAAPLAVVAGLALAGSLVMGPQTAVGRFASASVGHAQALLFGAPVEEPPAELIAYGPEQFHNFMRGIAAFSDADLLTFASSTQQSLGDHANPATAFQLDVLFLTYREIERRGMARPVAWLAVQDARDTYRQGNLEL